MYFTTGSINNKLSNQVLSDTVTNCITKQKTPCVAKPAKAPVTTWSYRTRISH